MSMRIYSREEFVRELEKRGFKFTGHRSETGKSEEWRTKDGQVAVISVRDQYPDYVLDRILDALGQLYIPLYDSNVRR
jgi:hypothetical protein